MDFASKAGAAGRAATAASRNIMARLEAIHNVRPLDLVLISGDMTDAGRATEWAEFIDALDAVSGAGRTDAHPSRQSRPQHRRPAQPGPARSAVQPGQAAAADAGIVGDRGRAGRPGARGRSRSGKLGRTLAEALAPHRQWIADFADAGSLRLAAGLGRLWDEQFPMILPPATKNGLAVVDPQLKRRNAFLLHQRARSGFRRADPKACGGDRPISGSPLGRRAASSSGGISDVGGDSSPSASGPRWSTAAGSSASSNLSPRARSSCTAIATSTGSAHAAS